MTDIIEQDRKRDGEGIWMDGWMDGWMEHIADA